jgi:hypothetical protein
MMNKISHVQFVDYLTEKLGLTEEETVKRLSELVLHIKKESASGTVSIQGLGTFSTENKNLIFTPDEAFEIEINHNYAGMMPVVIDPPKPKSTAAKKTDKDEGPTPAELPDEKSETSETPDFEEEEFVDVIGEDPFDFDDEEILSDEDKVTPGPSGDTSDVPGKKDQKPEKDPEAEEAERIRTAALKAEEKRMEEAAKKAEAEAEAESGSKDGADEVTGAAKSAAVSQVKGKSGETEKTEAADPSKKTPDAEPVSKTGKVPDVKPETLPDTEPAESGEAYADEEGKPKWIEPVSETHGSPADADEPVDGGRNTGPHDRNRPGGNTGITIAVLIAAVVVIAASLYFLGFLTTPTGTETVMTEQPASTNADQPSISEQEPGISEEEQLAAHEAEQDLTDHPEPEIETGEARSIPPPVEETSGEPTATSAAGYGLHGTINTNLQRPYTIIVHSLNSITDAEREKEQLSQEGYRSNFYAVELPDGRTRWRVSVGQFNDVESAVQASQELPEPYVSNNFIGRIESYNP